MLAENYPDEIKAIFAKYPVKRSAVMPLLYLAQREEGYIQKESMQEIAAMLELDVTEVAAIVGFYTMYHDEKAGKYRMQVCNDLPCALRGADKFLEHLCENIGVKIGETTPDGLITIEEVKCLGGCDRAPLFQLQQGDKVTYHENMNIDKTMELVDALRKAQE
ncbi:MAG TPA: NAD(P)H-dependent oxidoreductase subunit E [Anaerolineae bacterium]|jgi:NADH-quinone oxidoreductase subunit E|nr:NAD(P)H-dependent oxidoreductase subunit E [Anaerolineae bacterium]